MNQWSLTREADFWRSRVEARLAALEQRLAELAAAAAAGQGQWRRQQSDFSEVASAGPASLFELSEKLALVSESELSEDSAESAILATCQPTAADEALERAGSSTRLREVEEREFSTSSDYTLAESVWDVPLLAWLKCTGEANSWVMMFLVALNVVIQGFFIHVVIRSMLNNSFDDNGLSGLLDFRTGIAHSLVQADYASGHSLAAEICSQDSTVPWAGPQFNLFSTVKSYLGDGDHGGLLLSHLAILVWILKMSIEVDQIIHFSLALMQLPSCDRTLVARVGDDGPVKLLALSQARRLGMLLILGVRMAICLALGLIGVKYLVLTISLPDLILNSMALAFVLDIDELLFAAFISHNVKALLASMEGMPIRLPGMYMRRPHVAPLLKLMFVTSVVLAGSHVYLLPFYGRVAMASEIMCAGNLDFIYVLNTAYDLVTVTPTYPDGENKTDHGLRHRASVVKLAFPDLFDDGNYTVSMQSWGEPTGAAGAAKSAPSAHLVPREKRRHAKALAPGTLPFGPTRAWQEIPGMRRLLGEMVTNKVTAKLLVDAADLSSLARGIEGFPPSFAKMLELHRIAIGGVEGATENDMCYDILPAELPAAFLSAMSHIFPNATIIANYSDLDALVTETHHLHQCHQFTLKCPLKVMTTLRALCPITCGCQLTGTPAAAFFASQHFGCPGGCVSLKKAAEKWRKENNMARPCVDVDPMEFSSKEYHHLPGPEPTSEAGTSIDNFLASYMDGAFEYLFHFPQFHLNAKMVSHNELFYVPMNLSVAQRDEVAEYMTSLHFLNATQYQLWELLPGIPHPRGKRGCEFWVSWEVILVLGIDLCEVGKFRSLRYFCPQACQCLSSTMPECPGTCRSK